MVAEPQPKPSVGDSPNRWQIFVISVAANPLPTRYYGTVVWLRRLFHRGGVAPSTVSDHGLIFANVFTSATLAISVS